MKNNNVIWIKAHTSPSPPAPPIPFPHELNPYVKRLCLESDYVHICHILITITADEFIMFLVCVCVKRWGGGGVMVFLVCMLE